MKSRVLGLAVKPLYILLATSYLATTVFFRPTMVAAAGATLYVDTSTSSISDSTLGARVRINADDNNIGLVQFGLTYDAAKLEFLSVDNGGSVFDSVNATRANANVNVSADSSTAVNGDVPLAIVKFRILSRIGSTAIKFSSARIYNSNGTEVANWTSGATFDFSQPTTGTTVNPPATITPTPVAATPITRPPVNRQVQTTNASPTDDTVVADIIPPATSTPNQSLSSGRSGSVFLKPTSSATRTKTTPYWQWTIAALATITLAVVMFIYSRRVWRWVKKTHVPKIRPAVATVTEDQGETISRGVYHDQAAPGSIITWTNTDKQYEVIRPLASKPADDDLTPEDVRDMQAPILYIPVTSVQKDEAQPAEDEISGEDWAYDINSPLMNTL